MWFSSSEQVSVSPTSWADSGATFGRKAVFQGAVFCHLWQKHRHREGSLLLSGKKNREQKRQKDRNGEEAVGNFSNQTVFSQFTVIHVTKYLSSLSLMCGFVQFLEWSIDNTRSSHKTYSSTAHTQSFHKTLCSDLTWTIGAH